MTSSAKKCRRLLLRRFLVQKRRVEGPSPAGAEHPDWRGFQTLVQAAAWPVLQRMAAEQLITLEEIKKHTNEEDCWLVIHGAQLRLSPSVVQPPPSSCRRTQLLNGDSKQRTGRRRATSSVNQARVCDLYQVSCLCPCK